MLRPEEATTMQEDALALEAGARGSNIASATLCGGRAIGGDGGKPTIGSSGLCRRRRRRMEMEIMAININMEVERDRARLHSSSHRHSSL